jgi:AAA family ATP:ADP antiporter
MADAWRSEQAKRLFGFIGVGGTAGSIIGSAMTASLATHLGAVNMLLVSATLIELAILTITVWPLHTAAPGASMRETSADRGREVIGGTLWAGFTHVVKSPYLFGICLFQILYVFGSTVLYFAQSDIVGREYTNITSRTAVLADLELAAQVLTVVTQLFLTGRILRWFGLAVGLALLPAVSILGFGALGAMPAFATVALFTVLRRGMNFAVTNPAVEVLFTVVRREDKYKAKNVIETFVYRAGDQLAAWSYAGLAAVGLSLAGISFVAVPVSAVWLALAVWLGRRQSEMATRLPGPHYVGAALTPSAVPEPSRP